ncbi:unnamed protein product [Durusdinium trenchii]|uniref:Uncharacterized protein n=2 Tax=Durusdinium trenchii TaxID=1381693 RepID=A0ABP0JUI3_9DINO
MGRFMTSRARGTAAREPGPLASEKRSFLWERWKQQKSERGDARAVEIELEDEEAPLLSLQDQPRAGIQVVAKIVWPKELGYEPNGRMRLTTDFGLLVSLELKEGDVGLHSVLKLAPDKRVKEEQTQTFSFYLGPEEEIVGLSYHEVMEGEGSLYYHVHLILQKCHTAETWREPLSRHNLWPVPTHAGHLRDLPKGISKKLLKKLAEDGAEPAKAIQCLRFLKGKEQDHLTGVLYTNSSGCCDILGLTGQSMGFWLELILLHFGLPYMDLVLDIMQLRLFATTGMYDYVLFNLTGLALPVLISIRHVLEFFSQRNPELDVLEAGGRYCAPCLAIAMVLAVVLQMHIVCLTVWSASMRKMHPLLACVKSAEVGEAAVSAVVQMNFLVCMLAGVDAFSTLDLDTSQVWRLGASICISCFSLGLAFASKDTVGSKVLGLPGKLEMAPEPVLAGLVVVRALEVASRILSINVIHISTRMRSISVGGPVAILLLLLTSCLLLNEGGVPDYIAGVIGHPGQVLEQTSLLSIYRSLLVHCVLMLVALGLQLAARPADSVFDDAKVMPDWLMGLWLSTGIVSTVSLIAFARHGSQVEHPIFVGLKQKGANVDYLSYSALAAELQNNEVPKAAMEAAAAVCCIDADLQNGHLDPKSSKTIAAIVAPVRHMRRVSIRCDAISQLAKFVAGSLLESPAAMTRADSQNDVLQAMCNCQWGTSQPAQTQTSTWPASRGESGESIRQVAVALVSVLAVSNVLEELHLVDCRLIPQDAWMKLCNAKWKQLQKADFTGCFDRGRGKGAAALLEVLAQCSQLKELHLVHCNKIPGKAWMKLDNAKWKQLQKADFTGCFDRKVEDAEGAAPLLQALAQCPELKELRLVDCYKIPNDAWQKLCDYNAQWTLLEKVDFTKCFNDFSRSYFFDQQEPEGATILLQTLARCPNLQELSCGDCNAISRAWMKLCVAEWKQLKKADFTGCFNRARAADGSVAVLKLLAGCEQLEELQLRYCSAIPSNGWMELCNAKWAQLMKAEFWECFHDETQQGARGATTLLQVLAQCPKLKELGLGRCTKIPSTAWNCLSEANWTQLKKADFTACFDDERKGTEGAATLLKVLQRCKQLEDLRFGAGSRIPATLWEELRAGIWPQLSRCTGVPQEEQARLRGKADDEGDHLPDRAKDPEGSCNPKRTPGGSLRADELNVNDQDGVPKGGSGRFHLPKHLTAAVMPHRFDEAEDCAKEELQALASCKDLEDLNLSSCSAIPTSAWEKLRVARWAKLQRANFESCFDAESKGVGGATTLLRVLAGCAELKELNLFFCSAIPAAAWKKLKVARWPKLEKANFAGCFNSDSEAAEVADILLCVLAKCAELKELNLSSCFMIPAAAWKKLDIASWPILHKANFEGCFNLDSVGAEGAATLLRVLTKCAELVELNLSRCDAIPALAWEGLQVERLWPKLKRANLDGCLVNSDGGGAEGADTLRCVLRTCPQLKEAWTAWTGGPAVEDRD